MNIPCNALTNGSFGCETELTCDEGALSIRQGSASCCAHCKLSTWTDSGPCSVTCGMGSKPQKRQVLTSADANGQQCGDLERNVTCNAGCCPIDCVVGDWTTSKCSGTCGCGVKTKRREIKTPSSCGGAPCPHLYEHTHCDNLKPCPDEAIPLPEPPQTETPQTEPSEPIPLDPEPQMGCKYQPHWSNTGACDAICGVNNDIGWMPQARDVVDKDANADLNCDPLTRRVPCKAFCGVETRLWKNTYCSGRNLNPYYLDGFHNATDVPYCREQQGEEDASAIANCIELCDAVPSCVGFTFTRGTRNTNRCCFRENISLMNHESPGFACFEQKKTTTSFWRRVFGQWMR